MPQAEKLKSLRHLSRKTLIITISLLALSIAAIVVMERRSITGFEHENVRTALDAALLPATTSVEYLDAHLAQKITDGLTLLPKIYYSAIEDDFGKQLAESSRVPAEQERSSFMHWLVPLQDLQIEQEITTRHGGKGRIIVKATLNLYAARYTEKLLLYVGVQGLLSVLLVGFTMHFIAVRPLLKGIQKLHNWVHNFSRNQFTDDYENAYAYTELRDLHGIILQKTIDIDSKQQGLEQSLRRLNSQIALTRQQSQMLESVLLGSKHALIHIGSDQSVQVYDHRTDGKEILGGIPDSVITSAQQMKALLSENADFTVSDGQIVAAQQDEKILYELNIVESGSQRFRSLMAINLDKGAVVYLVKDITRAKELEAQNLQSQKMESLGVLSSGIAHDFNNILAIVLADLQLARQTSMTRQEHDERIDSAIKATQRGIDVVRMILAYSRRESSRSERINLQHHLGEFCHFVKSKIGSDFTLSLRADFTAYVDIDPARLDNTLMNLILNSRDAMGASGRLKVELLRMDSTLLRKAFGPQFTGSADNYVGITTQDNGSGIPPAAVSRIFDPFYTTKPMHQGTGLGLSISMANIEGVGGSLTLLDSSSKGTRFLIVLPRAEAVPEPREPRAGVNRHTPQQGDRAVKVLLVEDEPQLSSALCSSLAFAGISVLPANSVAKARHLLLTDDAISIVVTDYHLKDETGSEVLTFVRQHCDLPVILMSGNSQILDGSASAFSFDAQLVKPFSLDSLNQAVFRTVEGHRNRTTPSESTELS